MKTRFSFQKSLLGFKRFFSKERKRKKDEKGKKRTKQMDTQA
jgi:hypothetical protein